MGEIVRIRGEERLCALDHENVTIGRPRDRSPGHAADPRSRLVDDQRRAALLLTVARAGRQQATARPDQIRPGKPRAHVAGEVGDGRPGANAACDGLAIGSRIEDPCARWYRTSSRRNGVDHEVVPRGRARQGSDRQRGEEVVTVGGEDRAGGPRFPAAARAARRPRACAPGERASRPSARGTPDPGRSGRSRMRPGRRRDRPRCPPPRQGCSRRPSATSRAPASRSRPGSPCPGRSRRRSAPEPPHGMARRWRPRTAPGALPRALEATAASACGESIRRQPALQSGAAHSSHTDWLLA